MARIFFTMGSLFALLGVALGAFAAHLLKDRLSSELLAIFEVGVRYHMYHALGLLGIAWGITQFPHSNLYVAGWLFVAGIVIFSGSLYALSFSGIRWLGAITPFGGLCFLAGWLWAGWSVWKSV